MKTVNVSREQALAEAVEYLDSNKLNNIGAGSILHRKMKQALTPEQPSEQGDVGLGAEALAIRFHETYERLAPHFGYKTRQSTRKFDPGSLNGKLMIAVCSEILTTHKQEGKGNG